MVDGQLTGIYPHFDYGIETSSVGHLSQMFWPNRADEPPAPTELAAWKAIEMENQHQSRTFVSNVLAQPRRRASSANRVGSLEGHRDGEPETIEDNCSTKRFDKEVDKDVEALLVVARGVIGAVKGWKPFAAILASHRFGNGRRGQVLDTIVGDDDVIRFALGTFPAKG